MKKVLWISRHQMTKDQFADLRRIIGDNIVLDVYSDSVNDISDLYDAVLKADVVAAVLPTDLMSDLWKSLNGKMLLEAVSERIATDKVLELEDGRKEKEFKFKHKCWKQIIKYDVVSKEL